MLFCIALQPYVTDAQFMEAAKSVKPGEPGDSQFVKKLTSFLWSPDDLAERSSAGLICPTNGTGVARPEATPEKKRYLAGKCNGL
jgi:hypothetical protein